MAQKPIDKLLEIMKCLRHPETGCPWDREQDFMSIAPYTIEEAYEVADAITREDYADLLDELGDLLLQVVYHARMAEEKCLFNFDTVARGICEKMIKRHPHVFDGQGVESVGEEHLWEREKEKERRKKGHTSVMDGVAANLPALSLAHKLQVRASSVGFDWKEPMPVLEKISEEVDEVRTELTDSPIDGEKLAEEIGDLLFTVVNLARLCDVNPEVALRRAGLKFESRFRQLELSLDETTGSRRDATAEEMERIWEQIKDAEK